MTATATNPDSRALTDALPESSAPPAFPSTGCAWLERLALLVPGIAAIHLLAPRGKTLLELALAALLVTAVAAWAATDFRARGVAWFRRRGSATHLRIASRDSVLLAADALLRQAVADGRPLSVAVLELHDLPEVHRLFGRKLARQVVARTARSLRAVAGPKGLAVRTSPTQFTLVVPGVDEEAVLLSLRTVFGEACCIEDDGENEEVVLLPHFQVATVETGCQCIEPVYVRLCERLVSSLHRAYDRRHSLHAPVEAGPSQPVSLSQAQSELATEPVPTGYIPTVPMPLK